MNFAWTNRVSLYHRLHLEQISQTSGRGQCFRQYPSEEGDNQSTMRLFLCRHQLCCFSPTVNRPQNVCVSGPQGQVVLDLLCKVLNHPVEGLSNEGVSWSQDSSFFWVLLQTPQARVTGTFGPAPWTQATPPLSVLVQWRAGMCKEAKLLDTSPHTHTHTTHTHTVFRNRSQSASFMIAKCWVKVSLSDNFWISEFPPSPPPPLHKKISESRKFQISGSPDFQV